MRIEEEIKQKVIDWWFSGKGKMTDSRKEIVEKTIEFTLIESNKELLRIYEENKVSDTLRIRSDKKDKFIIEMEDLLCILRRSISEIKQRGTKK